MDSANYRDETPAATPQDRAVWLRRHFTKEQCLTLLRLASEQYNGRDPDLVETTFWVLWPDAQAWREHDERGRE